MLEKFALLKIAFCNAPVLSRAASRRTAVTISTVLTKSTAAATSSLMAGSSHCVGIPPTDARVAPTFLPQLERLRSPVLTGFGHVTPRGHIPPGARSAGYGPLLPGRDFNDHSCEALTWLHQK